MKRVLGQTTETSFETLNFDVLTNEEMNTIKGGIDSRPKSREKDVYDLEEV